MQPYRDYNRICLCGALIALSLLVQSVAASGLRVATAGLFHASAAEVSQTQTADAAAVPPPETAESADLDPAAADDSAPDAQQPTSDTAAPDAPALPDSTDFAPFTATEAAAIKVGGGCTYTVDKQSLLLQPAPLQPVADGPQVLIIHTHGSEAYTQEAGFSYPESDPFRTQDNQYNVVRVGQELADTLASLGIEAIHDTASHDSPTYNGAYARTLTDIEADLAAYPTIRMVLDIHRDAIEDEDGNLLGTAVSIGGESVAKIMLVVGTDEGGLTHPNWQDNLSCALKIDALLERRSPGICRMVDLRTERFNQHTSPGALLLEIGSSGDTLSQALSAARLAGQAIAALLQHTP